ncbi:TIGR04086 family membrane protein [Arthrobacter sp. zg-Y750]|uniref:TIGR04086 family membrane protein n=1 Tax=Arthrobacter sp. zg-Y750 TaxID=2894189 RepID=UPI001E2E0A09|nr:TIGR04086 family membrane protein [Arthrobacter sp. zg-Y750]MCC9176748.1 TIGR04086 family membrane protein [Arthrobacter sp. zg-Y750]
MSTEPGNTSNASAAGRGAADGGPMRDRSDRPAADDAARTAPEHGTEDTGTRVIRTDSAPATTPVEGTGRHTGSHTAQPADGYEETRVAPAASNEHPTAGHTADENTRTRAVPATEDTATRAVPATDSRHAEDTRTRVAPVTASRDLPEETDHNRHTDRADRDVRDAHGTRHDDADRDGVVREAALPNREALLAREKERFGGMKFGSAFFGWLTATGMVVLLSALAAAIGAAIGLSAETNLGAALESAAANQSAGIIGAVIMLVVLLLSYYAGGYVAGRMARFNGLKQGLAVWLWALIAAAVVVILGLIYGSDIRSISQLNSVAPLPENLENVSAGTWLAVAASLVVTLIGAILGGLAGMRFHRRIDRADFRTEETVSR